MYTYYNNVMRFNTDLYLLHYYITILTMFLLNIFT